MAYEPTPAPGRGPDRERVAASARVVLDAMDALEAAVNAYSWQLAVPEARTVVDGIEDQEQLRRVAAALAVMAVWQVPPAPARIRRGPLSAEEIRARNLQIRSWISAQRLEALWEVSG